MNERDVTILRTALKDAIIFKQRNKKNSDPNLLMKNYQRLLDDLSKVTWELQIWRGGELYSVCVDEDPNEVLQWAANYRDWDYPEGLSPADAFRHVRHLYNEMDITFTKVLKWRGDILIFEEEHAEDLLLEAAEEKELLNV